jgi:hypothetical protein
MKISRTLLALTVFVGLARPVGAQGGYVSASLVGDIARFDRVEGTAAGESGSGEALGFGLRVGTPLGSRWGVELEFVRPSEISSEFSPEILPLLTDPLFSALPPVGSSLDLDLTFPSYSYDVRTKQRNTTIAATVWIAQRLTPKFSLSYLGGISFGRTTREIEFAFQPIRFPILPIPNLTTETTTYDVGPLVGLEGSIVLTEHVQLVPGIRLHGVEGGWLLRPAVGLGWVF